MADPPHHCVRVSENARGAQLLAIATGKKSHSGVLIQDKMLEHVLCAPMTFASKDAGTSQHIAFVCTCSDMASRVESIISRCTTRLTYSGRSLAVAFLMSCPLW
ncbi:TPA: hypothetical protein ACH3X2_009605 [Trebouxia sp. C0005]